MTRENAKEICDIIETHGIEVIKAYGEGKIIQALDLDGEWVDRDMPISFSPNHSYRIKPEKDYRPFEDCAELMVEFAKRFNVSNIPSYAEPFIWVKEKRIGCSLSHYRL